MTNYIPIYGWRISIERGDALIGGTKEGWEYAI